MADEGAASTDLRDGDRIWWDRHDWGLTNTVPAVVGSFPEPFLHGIDGEKLPTRIECEKSAGAACDVVQDKLTDLGIVAGKALPGTASGTDVLRIVVGEWRDLRDDSALRQIERGPRASGVYGRFEDGGRSFAALDARGRVARKLGRGDGRRSPRPASARTRRCGRSPGRTPPASPPRPRPSTRACSARSSRSRSATSSRCALPAEGHDEGSLRRRRARVIYSRRASPLHAARAACSGAWCVALAGAALAFHHPLVLGALLVAVLAGAAGAGVGHEVARMLRYALPFALFIALINPLVSRNGLTVIARLGEVPPFGQVDLTLEALVYGAMFGLRLLVVVLAFGIATYAVDPDEVLRLFRRVSFRSALTAALAVRLVPGAARRRAAAGGGAPLPRRRRRVAARDPARGRGGRARPGDRRRGDARGPRLRDGVEEPRGRAAVVAARHVVPRFRLRDRRAGRRARRPRGSRTSRRSRRSSCRWAPPRSRSPSRWSSSRCCRSSTAGGSSA